MVKLAHQSPEFLLDIVCGDDVLRHETFPVGLTIFVLFHAVVVCAQLFLLLFRDPLEFVQVAAPFTIQLLLKLCVILHWHPLQIARVSPFKNIHVEARYTGARREINPNLWHLPAFAGINCRVFFAADRVEVGILCVDLLVRRVIK